MAQGLGHARPQAPAGLDALSGPLALRTFYVVRHAKAGDREEWTGDDRLRPLTNKGLKQAEALVKVFKGLGVKDIYSSPYVRCTQSVEPLAKDRRLEVRPSPSLEEGHGLEGLAEFLSDRSLADVVLSTHGDIVWELVEDLVAREVIRAGDGGYQKGSTWVLEVDEHGVAERARYIAAP
ncbi:MAG TPA: phosphoglycerate mutase family protein [Candidatus Limnocylindrales bacterium]|nr:phosphoglycerate mutase family protein [Candidatus Limnocylindrales bacterium]